MNEGVVEEVKSRIDLAELIASYGVQIKRSGSGYKACCPFHHEKTPSFVINPARGFYHCFGCGEKGDAIAFVMKQEGLSFPEALRKLADQCGVKVEEVREDPEAGRRRRLFALMGELAGFYHRCLVKSSEASLAREYLAKRALDAQAAEDWLIGYAPTGVATILKWAEKYGYTAAELEAAGVIKAPNRPGDRGYHRFGGRLMFSIRDRQGRVAGFSGRQLVEQKNSGKYVNSPQTAIFEKKSILFGFDKAAGAIANAPHREVIVCEGQIDCIRLHLNGFTNAVASQGTAFTDEHMRMLRRVADAAILVFDDDNAGHKATIRSAAMLLEYEMPVRTVSLPDGDDPDSFLRNHPPEDFRRLIDRAESIVSFQCRVEKAKETDPGSIDAVARISKAVLGTIACCKSAILRVQMTGEAARLLNLPVAALTEELAKIKPERTRTAEPAAPEPEYVPAPIPEDPSEPVAGEAQEEPPSARELSFCEFLTAVTTSPDAATIVGAVGEFLPDAVFDSPFTRGFVAAWRLEAGGEETALAAFADALGPRERLWFDSAYTGSDKFLVSSMSPVEILQDFVRVLWKERLKRLRGALPAAGDPDAEMKRLRFTAYLKRLDMVKWHDVKDMVRELAAGENNG